LACLPVATVLVHDAPLVHAPIVRLAWRGVGRRGTSIVALVMGHATIPICCHLPDVCRLATCGLLLRGSRLALATIHASARAKTLGIVLTILASTNPAVARKIGVTRLIRKVVVGGRVRHLACLPVATVLVHDAPLVHAPIVRLAWRGVGRRGTSIVALVVGGAPPTIRCHLSDVCRLAFGGYLFGRGWVGRLCLARASGFAAEKNGEQDGGREHHSRCGRFSASEGGLKCSSFDRTARSPQNA